MFQCSWPGHPLTAPHKLGQGAYGDLIPLPWACLGCRFEVYCLARLKLPRMVIIVWFEFIPLYTWSWPFCWLPHILLRCSVSTRSWGTVEPELRFWGCICRSFIAVKFAEWQNILQTAVSFFSLSHSKVSMWTWAAFGGLSVYRFPLCDLEETAEG